MLTQFSFHAPSFVVSGRDSCKKTGSLLESYGATGKVLLVCGSKTSGLGLLDPVVESVQAAGLKPVVFNKSLPDAPVEVVREGIQVAKQEQISAVVAFGGGSAMDTAKAIACMTHLEGDVLDYCRGTVAPAPRKCLLFAIPTTCGTGSEATDIGVVLDRQGNYKYIFANPFAGPDVAILDPLLLLPLSPQMIAATAMDAFSHSAEAYTCRAANVMMEPLALCSMREIVTYLPKALSTSGEARLDAIERLLIASCMAGQAFTQVGLHLGHAIAHGIGVHGHVHHGAACALALPYALASVSGEIPERISVVGELMGISFPSGCDAKEIGRLVGEELLRFNRSVGILSLGQYGVTEDMLDAMAEYAIHEEGTQGNSYRRSPKEELLDYLHRIL